MNQQNDRVIKVKNVFAYIRKYIALVIVLALCGAVGLAGLCYLKNKREIDAEQSQTPVKLEDMYEEFSETEKADISYALYSYDRMAEIEQYLDESLYMQIEPYHMQQKTYQCDAGYCRRTDRGSESDFISIYCLYSKWWIG